MLLLLSLILTGPTNVQAAPANRLIVSDVTIYQDSLAAGWEDWSWDSTINLTNGAPVHGGTASVAVTFNQPFAGFSVRTSAPLNTSGYTTIAFWIYGGAGGTQLDLATQPTDNGALSSIYNFTASANTWSYITIPLTALGNPTAIARINLQEATGAVQPTFYLDDIQLLGSTPPAGDLPDSTADRVLGQTDLQSSGSGSTAASLYGPAAALVTPTGQLFVADYRNSRVLIWNNAATLANGQAADYVIGRPDLNSAGPDPFVFCPVPSASTLCGPEGLAFDSRGNGKLYVADTHNHRVLEYSGPFNASNKAASRVFGQGDDFTGQGENRGRGEDAGPDSLYYPRGLAFDSQTGRLFVADDFNRRIVIFNADEGNTLGDFVLGQANLDAEFPDCGAVTATSLCSPKGLAFDPANNALYVADYAQYRVLQYSGPFNTNNKPAQRAFGQSQGNLTMSERSCQCQNGAYEEISIKLPGNIQAGGLCNPLDVGVDADGNLFVADATNSRVLVYLDPLNADVTAAVIPDAVFGQQDSLITGDKNKPDPPAQPQANNLHRPMSMAFYQGALYQADFENNRLLVFLAPTVTPSDKWALWSNGTQLRGVNIYQRRSNAEADGDLALVGPVIPPYTQADFDKMAAMGANYVNISHPGLFTEEPPYQLDTDIQANLDQLLTMIANANLYAVISFRTGPGRNEFTFLDEEDPNWVGHSLDINFVWTDQAAQDGWADMWQYTADRYRSNPTVVGYDLMVEPNSNVLLNVWDPTDFYPTYANTLYDWNQFFPDISTAIRQVDSTTPILIGGLSYSSVNWLPYVIPTGDPRTVYTAHTYEPFSYTHQGPPLTLSYPGTFDADGDGQPDTVDQSWLNNWLAPINAFRTAHNVPVAVNEYGVKRWQPGAAEYMADQMALFEQRGLNHAWWLWGTADSRFVDTTHDFNALLGPNPGNRQEVETSALLEVIRQNWALNTVNGNREKLFLPLALR